MRIRSLLITTIAPAAKCSSKTGSSRISAASCLEFRTTLDITPEQYEGWLGLSPKREQCAEIRIRGDDGSIFPFRERHNLLIRSAG